MRLHTMRLNDEPFNLIKTRKKIIELRLLDEKRRSINLEDALEFVHREDADLTISAKISAIFYYNTFANLISDLPIQWFGYQTKNEVIDKVSSIYSPEQEKLHSVVGFKFEIEGVYT